MWSRVQALTLTRPRRGSRFGSFRFVRQKLISPVPADRQFVDRSSRARNPPIYQLSSQAHDPAIDTRRRSPTHAVRREGLTRDLLRDGDGAFAGEPATGARPAAFRQPPLARSAGLPLRRLQEFHSLNTRITAEKVESVAGAQITPTLTNGGSPDAEPRWCCRKQLAM